MFAVPLLVYQLTGSALDLGIAVAVEMLPYPLFGLILGAWADRVDRKRLMIWTDVARAVVIGSIPVAAGLGILSVWWLYVAVFIASTLTIAFQAAEFAAIPSLVERDELVTANGRIQASFSAASVLGPVVAGALLGLISLPVLFALDAATYAISAVSIALIRRELQGQREAGPVRIRADIAEGLRYVIAHPVLRNISAMMALVNFIGTTAYAQIVLFANVRFTATPLEVSLFFSAGAVGVVVFSLAAGTLRRRWTFGVVALGALMLQGLAITGMAIVPALWAAIALYSAASGFGMLFNINTGSLRQAIVPERMLGRIMSIAMVLAFSANPLGAIAGGLAIDWTRNIVLIYAVIGALQFGIALWFFLFSPLRHAERYMPTGPKDAVEAAASG